MPSSVQNGAHSLVRAVCRQNPCPVLREHSRGRLYALSKCGRLHPLINCTDTGNMRLLNGESLLR